MSKRSLLTKNGAFITTSVTAPFSTSLSARATNNGLSSVRRSWTTGTTSSSSMSTRIQRRPRSCCTIAMVAATGTPTIKSRKVGEIVNNFRLVREEPVAEISSVTRLWEHVKTGTQLLSVLNDDENKTFGVVLRTPPSDSTGVPHILEHSVLCGSTKYPVKEPFVELIKSSLNTFLNAFTYPDKTCYPVASCNERDFYNLVDVYLDAVFHPTLTPDTLAQEGHHLEMENPNDKVTIKGVVYNEMKGAYSSSDRVLSELSQRMLFPETTYGVESGGHPRDIPDLTWETFKKFYDQYYHPTNARLWFYGDDAEEKRLAKADSFLKDFDYLDVNSAVGLQSRWSEPRSYEFTYDAGSADLSKKFMGTLNWLIDPPVDKIDPAEGLALSVMNHILLSTSSSPLRKALTDSQLGEDVVGGGLETDLRQMTFSVGLKGMPEEAIEKMHQVVFDVLNDVKQNGFKQGLIDSSLNTIEFSLRENNTGSFPKGLALMLRSMSTWLHDADPLIPLKFEASVRNLRDRLERGEPVFQECVDKYLLSNSHRASVNLRPDAEFAQKEDAAEQKRIEMATSGFTEEDYKKLVSETRRLKEQQVTPDRAEDVAKIPTLTLDDLDKNIKTVAYERLDDKGVMIVHHPQNTSGVVYVDLVMDMKHVSNELLPLMTVLSGALSELGTGKRDYAELQQKIGSETGGISAGTFISQMYSPDGTGKPLAKLTVRCKSMVGQIGSLFDIIGEILTDTDFNNKDRIRQLLIEERAGLESGIPGSGHSIASGRLGAMYRSSLWADEQMGGVEYLKGIRKLIERVDNDWDSVVEDMKNLEKCVVTREDMMVNITTSSNDFVNVRPALMSFLDRLPEKSTGSIAGWMSSSTSQLLKRTNEGLIVPSTVNYVGKAGNLLDMGFKVTGGHSLASKYLGTSYLWDTVRVQGGAYGGFCRLDPRTGMFMYLSYRDPNVNGTLKSYDGAAEFLNTVDLSKEDLTKAVISTIGSMDSYQLPDRKGFASALRLLSGESDEIRQEKRNEVLGASVKDFRELGEALDTIKKHGTVVVIGGSEALNAAKEEGLDLQLETIV